ncbi:Type IV fimbrial biogenesis protein PilY1, partial [Olavius sp. associated proteobacterium Delta 1]
RDITIGGLAKTYLVGGLGKGGKGYYALDVTDPGSIGDEDDLAARALWEVPDPRSEGSLAFKMQGPPRSVGDVIYTLGTGGITAQAEIAAIPYMSLADGVGIFDLINVTGTFEDGDDLFVGSIADPTKVAEATGRLYDSTMGYSYSRPVIAKSNDTSEAEWLVIFGNGYDSQKSHAVLYILNLATGDVIK